MALGFAGVLLYLSGLHLILAADHPSYVAAVYEHRVRLNSNPRVPLDRRSALEHMKQNLHVFEEQAVLAAQQVHFQTVWELKTLIKRLEQKECNKNLYPFKHIQHVKLWVVLIEAIFTSQKMSQLSFIVINISVLCNCQILLSKGCIFYKHFAHERASCVLFKIKRPVKCIEQNTCLNPTTIVYQR